MDCRLVVEAVVAARIPGCRLFCPEDVRHRSRPVRMIPLVLRTAPVGGLAHEHAPAIRVVRHFRIRSRRSRRRPRRDGGRAVEVSVDAAQHVVVVLVRVSAQRDHRAGRAACCTRHRREVHHGGGAPIRDHCIAFTE